jgi:hypothetical protein
VVCRRFLDPAFTNDLLSLPATAIQKQIAELRHVAWPQKETSASVYDIFGKFRPVIIRDAERLEKVSFGKLVSPQSLAK